MGLMSWIPIAFFHGSIGEEDSGGAGKISVPTSILRLCTEIILPTWPMGEGGRSRLLASVRRCLNTKGSISYPHPRNFAMVIDGPHSKKNSKK